MKIDSYDAPIMLTWQLTKDCNLACLHCCTDSAPGRAMPGELDRAQALELVRQISQADVPYVMLCGGEPTIVPHFLEVAEILGKAGVYLKIETNGQKFDEALGRRLSALPIRSIQVSLDGATQEVYAKMRPGASLESAASAARLAVKLGMPLEVTFAPTRLNIHEAEQVIDLVASLGAFRFNTGMLMRLGTAAKLWPRLEPTFIDYEKFFKLLERKESEYKGRLELCFRPFSLQDEFLARSAEPPGTLLILPDGRVKVSAALPYVCADLKRQSLLEAWQAYRRAWNDARVVAAMARLGQSPAALSEANELLPLYNDLPAMV